MQNEVNGIQAGLKRMEAGILNAQAALCDLEQYRSLAGQTAEPDKINKLLDQLIQHSELMLKKKKALHRIVEREANKPRPRIGT